MERNRMNEFTFSQLGASVFALLDSTDWRDRQERDSNSRFLVSTRCIVFARYNDHICRAGYLDTPNTSSERHHLS
jgi:hypothetical protein